MYYLVSVEHNSWQQISAELIVRGFSKCCMSNWMDGTDGDIYILNTPSYIIIVNNLQWLLVSAFHSGHASCRIKENPHNDFHLKMGRELVSLT